MHQRHYEIVFLVNPEQTKDEAKKQSDLISGLVKENGGSVHREESWGLRELAYPINKLSRAYYFLLNIECTDKVIAVLNHEFRYNKEIIRRLILSRGNDKITEPSIMLAETNDNKEENI